MKKLIIVVVLFAVIAIGFTAGMIAYQRKSNHTEPFVMSGDKVEEKEKTIDLYATYDENDLKTETIPYDDPVVGKTFEILQIHGLKDKAVEAKVNQSLEQKAKDFLQMQYEKMTEEEKQNVSFSMYIRGSFANVLSVQCYVYYYEGDTYEQQQAGVNYELVHGNELQFEDLFTKEADLALIVRRMFYKSLADAEVMRFMDGPDVYDTPYFDAENGIWLAKYYHYDYENGTSTETVKEFVPKYTDYDIEKLVKKFMHHKEASFTFSPYSMSIFVGEDSGNIKLIDMADQVTIYDKFLTSESIFEHANIGKKNLLTCTNYIETGIDKQVQFASDNFFYDTDCFIRAGNYYPEPKEYPAQRYLDTKKQEQLSLLHAKVEEYRQIAERHPDKAYFLIAESDINCGWYSTSHMNEELGYYEWTNETNNLLETEFKTKLIVCGISLREKVLNEILKKYRYHNIGFYGTIYNAIDNENYIAGFAMETPVEEKIEKHLYDVETNREYKEVKDIFIHPEKYEEILRAKIQYMDDPKEYELSYNGIIARDGQSYTEITYDNLRDEVKVKVLQPELLPKSSSEPIERSFIEDWDKATLIKAYNEIFARSGHDFQTKELKDYFMLWNWYQPIEGKVVSLEELNPTEQYNVQLIKSVMEEK